MDKEIKKQLTLSVGILILVVLSMLFWYDNFMFHTYIKKVDYQYCFSGNNDDVMIQGYELFQNSQKSYSGNGRLLSTENNFFLKGDQVECYMTFIDNHNQKYQLTHQYKIKSSNEVCYLSQQEDHKKDNRLKISQAYMQLKIKRHDKYIYDKKINLNSNELVIYNGSNKDYSIQNVYVNDYWLKTGYISSTIDNLSKQYQQCVIDYVCLKDEGNEEDVNDYDRIIHLTGETSTIMKNEQQEVYFHDQQGQLLQKDIKCVISLYKDENDQKPLTFVIDLHGIMKAGVSNE